MKNGSLKCNNATTPTNKYYLERALCDMRQDWNKHWTLVDILQLLFRLFVLHFVENDCRFIFNGLFVKFVSIPRNLRSIFPVSITSSLRNGVLQNPIKVLCFTHCKSTKQLSIEFNRKIMTGLDDAESNGMESHRIVRYVRF